MWRATKPKSARLCAASMALIASARFLRRRRAGATDLQIPGLREHFPSDRLRPRTLSAVHLNSEASRLAYADRAQWLGDPDFVAVPLAGLLDRAYLDARARLIDPMRAMGTAR